ncbi:MAG: hypothetical protein QOI10_1059 [Solirubrobacterales bacterium]|jgi:hypothetical protein|nr:hypothetical protein [Solirubrobacterales bacterium]
MPRILAVAIAAAALLAAAAPALADSVPLPENDPFYAIPKRSRLEGKPNGKVLDSRQVEVNASGVRIPATAWQVKYKTLDVHGRPSAYVATVMIPDAASTGPGPRPLVSYQTAEDGVGSKCSPSYGLRAGFEAGGSNSANEANAMRVAMERGWAIVAPDYEGPRSEFLGAKGEARGVIDGVRATLRFQPAGFDRKRTPVGLWGYSGGALASTLAAQLQPRYAPDLHFAGVALGGTPADIEAVMRAFSGSPFGGAIAIGLVGADRSYPAVDVQQYLSDFGREAVANSQSDCINDSVQRYPGARIEDFATDPAVFELPAVQRLLRKMSPLWFRGTPSAPVYEYHAVADELAPIGPARLLVQRFCDAGVTVQHVEDHTSEHVSLVVSGATGAMDYLGARFAGEPAPSTC